MNRFKLSILLEYLSLPGCEFQIVGLAYLNARQPYMQGTVRRIRLADRR